MSMGNALQKIASEIRWMLEKRVSDKIDHQRNSHKAHLQRQHAISASAVSSWICYNTTFTRPKPSSYSAVIVTSYWHHSDIILTSYWHHTDIFTILGVSSGQQTNSNPHVETWASSITSFYVPMSFSCICGLQRTNARDISNRINQAIVAYLMLLCVSQRKTTSLSCHLRILTVTTTSQRNCTRIWRWCALSKRYLSVCWTFVYLKLNAFLQAEVIPLVMGRRAQYATHAPPWSYIQADAFESPRLLAEYLHLLDKNDDLYNRWYTCTLAPCPNLWPD